MKDKIIDKKLFAFLFIVYSSSFTATRAQQHKTDSMLHVLSTQRDDTNKVKTLNSISISLSGIDPDSSILFSQQAIALASKLDWMTGEANGYTNAGTAYRIKSDYSKASDYYLKALKIGEDIGNKLIQANDLGNLGIIYYSQGDYSKAIDYDQRALKMSEELGYKIGIARNLNILGIVYFNQGEYPKALDTYFKSLKIQEDNGYKGQVGTLCNIGLVYEKQEDYSKAISYFQKALKMAEGLGDKVGQAAIFGNLGNVCEEQGDHHKALTFHQQALEMDEEMGNKVAQEEDFGNLGGVYKELGDNTKALDYEMKALKMSEELGDKNGIALNQGNIGSIYTKIGKFKEAEEYLKKSIALDSSIGDPNMLREMEELLSQLYDTSGRSKLALIWFKKAMVLKDTLFNIDKNKALTRNELTYQYEKKEAAEKAEQDKKDAIAEADKHKQKIITWSVSVGMLLVIVFAAFIFRSLRITRKQKQIIEIKNKETEEQKMVIEERNKDILDSINYAKRLQDAILPPIGLVKQFFPESFILYKPKDIVAGDFYWMQKVASINSILIAAADCTGHGVPGAMVSVVCSNAINRIVKETAVRDTGSVLDNVRNVVLETFSQRDPLGEKSDGNVQDGMDISMCAINLQTNILEWSGANNPLWYIHKNKLIEITADKQPVGKQDNAKPFTTHLVNIEKGDIIYLFTDGYADQFGGPKGKKFKYKQLQDLLLANASKTMDEQKNVLENTLSAWKGSLEQVDDILIMGIRI